MDADRRNTSGAVLAPTVVLPEPPDTIAPQGSDHGPAASQAFEIGGVALAVIGMVEEGVEVVEDLFFGDRGVGVVLAELGDGGVFEMGEGEALRPALGQKIADDVRHECEEGPVRAGFHPDDEAGYLGTLIDLLV